MTDFSAFVPVVNRPDLLENVLHATHHLWDGMTVIDNSPDRWVQEKLRADMISVPVFTPPVPLHFSQTMNWEMEETMRRGKRFCIHMHSDAIIPEGACQRLLEFARKTDAEIPRWGVIYTHYDVLAVYNSQAFQEIGGYDTVFSAYFSDNDWYRRLELAGWTRVQSDIEIGHIGSQTLNSDPELQFLNGITFPLFREYYRQKWNGWPGQERLTVPFGRSA